MVFLLNQPCQGADDEREHAQPQKILSQRHSRSYNPHG